MDKALETAKLASDSPLTDPANDVYGYARFARELAKAIRRTDAPAGLIMAVHGAWGSGKSTLLNFVKYELNNESDSGNFVVIEFNPWWFDDHQMLATQFLAQFSAKLPKNIPSLKKIGNVMAEYSGAIGKFAATVSGHTWLPIAIESGLSIFRSKAKDVPALKHEIGAALEKSGKRFIFIVDDLDRLEVEELRQVFKVLKAIANFPNVIYLLAFDRVVVAQALHDKLGIDAEPYLEKIVQAPFSLPTLDRATLLQELNRGLDRILKTNPGSSGTEHYWHNAFNAGLHRFISKPRDIVRILNVLNVTYPTVAGEVNFVDFFALEFLRIFEPALYGTIRDNGAKFAGVARDEGRGPGEAERAFHVSWGEKIDPERRIFIQQLMRVVFPRVNSIWENISYADQTLIEWRKTLRVCSPDHFDTYFRFAVPDGRVSRRELGQFIKEADRHESAQTLLNATEIRYPNGASKAQSYLDQLRVVVPEITPQEAVAILQAIFDVGDRLFPRVVSTDLTPGYWQIAWLVDDLLGQVPPEHRAQVLTSCLKEASATGLVVQIAEIIHSRVSSSTEPKDTPLTQFTTTEDELFTRIAAEALRALTPEQLASLPSLYLMLDFCERVEAHAVISEKMSAIFASDDLLPAALEGFLTRGSRQTAGEYAGEQLAHLSPKRLTPFTDISALVPRIEKMLERSTLTTDQREAGVQFLHSMGQIQRGIDPDSIPGRLRE
jgi:predicted KAP-like P-loop ATPase